MFGPGQCGTTQNFLDVSYDEQYLEQLPELQRTPPISAFETRTTRLREAEIFNAFNTTIEDLATTFGVSWNELKKATPMKRTRKGKVPGTNEPVAQFMSPHKHNLRCREEALTLRRERGEPNIVYNQKGGESLTTENIRIGLRIVGGEKWDGSMGETDGGKQKWLKKSGRIVTIESGVAEKFDRTGMENIVRLKVTGIGANKYNGVYNKAGVLNKKPRFVKEGGCSLYYNRRGGWAFDCAATEPFSSNFEPHFSPGTPLKQKSGRKLSRKMSREVKEGMAASGEQVSGLQVQPVQTVF
jgi:hypothetical protein